MILQKRIKVNTIEDIKKAINEANVTGFVCPECESHEFIYYGSYRRYLIIEIDGKTEEISVKIKRIRCKCCGKTHAVIPDFIVPYKIYSLKIINKVIYLKETNNSKCKEDKYGISRQLIRKWIKEFKKIKNKVMMIIEKIEEIEKLEVERYYNEYLEIYMMNRVASYRYTTT